MLPFKALFTFFFAVGATAKFDPDKGENLYHDPRPVIPFFTDVVDKQPPANPVPVPFRELDGKPVDAKQCPYLIPPGPKLPHTFYLQMILHGLEYLSQTQEALYNNRVGPNECSKFNESRVRLRMFLDKVNTLSNTMKV